MTSIAADMAPPATSAEEVDACIASGCYGQALATIRHGLAARPHDGALLSAQASTLFAWGRFREAREAYQPVIAQGMAGAQSWLEAAWLQDSIGRFGEAEAWMRKAVAMDPDNVAAHLGLASVLQRLGRFDEAIALCIAAAKRWPDDARFALCIGQCHLRQGKPAQAESQFRRALDSKPEQPTIWINLGKSLRLQERHTEALETFDRAMALASKGGEPVDAFLEVATEYQLMGQNDIAASVLEENLAREPAIEGYRAYSEVLLASGRFDEGWHHYEARWLLEPLVSTRAAPSVPEWNGQDLSGRTVLLRVEQGFGDVIMALRYAPAIKALGATVLLGRFSDLAYGFAGIDRVLDEAVATTPVDYCIAVMSLPRIFAANASTIPAEVPYLRVDAARVEAWRKRLPGDGRFRVGLAWAGSPLHPWDRYRSMTLHDLSPLWDADGVRFVSLQKGATAEDARTLSARPDIVNLGQELVDLADTAAVVSQLDLVVCVDTAVAHLAGALGKPVWVMVAQPSDWRWMKEREDSPWYPMMRLFRQRKPGDWPEVVARLKHGLHQCLHEDAGSHASTATRPARSPPLKPKPALARLSPGHKPGFTAVAGTRVGIVQYFPDEPFVGDSISWYGEYLQPRLDLLRRLIGPGATLMEVGAGTGVHALYLAAAVGSAGHVFLYEAQPLRRRVLRQNLAANRVGSVTLMRRMLGATSEADDRSCETVDDLHLQELRLLKINEAVPALAVLTGAKNTLWRLRPLLCVAVPDPGVLNGLAAVARDLGYRSWRVDTPLFNSDNFNRRSDDIFDGKAASALLASPEESEIDLPREQCIEI